MTAKDINKEFKIEDKLLSVSANKKASTIKVNANYHLSVNSYYLLLILLSRDNVYIFYRCHKDKDHYDLFYLLPGEQVLMEQAPTLWDEEQKSFREWAPEVQALAQLEQRRGLPQDAHTAVSSQSWL